MAQCCDTPSIENVQECIITWKLNPLTGEYSDAPISYDNPENLYFRCANCKTTWDSEEGVLDDFQS